MLMLAGVLTIVVSELIKETISGLPFWSDGRETVAKSPIAPASSATEFDSKVSSSGTMVANTRLSSNDSNDKRRPDSRRARSRRWSDRTRLRFRGGRFIRSSCHGGSLTWASMARQRIRLR